MKVKKKYFKNFILDVDGVLTTGQFFYDQNGKKYKVFSVDDKDALTLLKKYIKISFITSDIKGFKISKKRVEDMGFKLKYVKSLERANWIKKNYKSKKTIYMGDGIFDFLVFKQVGYSICPNNADFNCKKKADFVTKNKSGERALSEACLHIISNLFKKNFLDLI